jgi:hypothetical protein
MATNPQSTLERALIRHYRVPATKTVTKGMRVKFSGADDQIENCGAGEDGFAIALETVVGSATASARVALEGFTITPVLVGTGGATRGSYAVPVADGWTDRAIADGTNPRYIGVKFLENGVAGDLVGGLQGFPTPTPTA